MNWQDVIVIVIGAVVALLILRSIVRMVRSGGSSRCEGCSNKGCKRRK